MVSLQSQNQLFQQLTQLTSVLYNNPNRMLFSVIVRRLNHSWKNEPKCRKIYVNIDKNHIAMTIKRTNMNTTGATRITSKSNIWIDFNDLKLNTQKIPLDQDCNMSSTSSAKDRSNFNKHIQYEKMIFSVSKHSFSKQDKYLKSSCTGNTFNYCLPIHAFGIPQNIRAKWFVTSVNCNLNNTNLSKGNRYISTSFKGNSRTEDEKKDESSKKENLMFSVTTDKKKFKLTEWITAVSILMILLTIAFAQVEVTTTANNRITSAVTKVDVTFDDIKGVDSAKKELQDMVQFLKNPEKFLSMGAKLPKGVLLVGYPGTGKTLLARAVAAEANVPFFPASGPEFDGFLVGQGARKIKELFKNAKKNAPAVIFIDEIDSVGRQRINSVFHPFANQTINQLLTEMDGFSKTESVIVLGATNRLSDIDPALLRAGRFDVHIYVPMPDYAGRKEILDFYLKKVLARDINLDYLAKNTYGFSSAALENLVNQAAIRAAVLNAEFVSMDHLDYARDKVTIGPERTIQKRDEEQIRRAAYHEAGHALVTLHTSDAMEIHKITILPHGLSLGHVAYLSADDQWVTKAQLRAQLDAALGGRVAEELIYGPDYITTNAADDLKTANNIAEKMVLEFGMSDKIGTRVYVSERNKEHPPPKFIDKEVSQFLNDAFERAKNILQTHREDLDKIANALIEKETMSGDELKALLNVKVVSPVVERL